MKEKLISVGIMDTVVLWNVTLMKNLAHGSPACGAVCASQGGQGSIVNQVGFDGEPGWTG